MSDLEGLGYDFIDGDPDYPKYADQNKPRSPIMATFEEQIAFVYLAGWRDAKAGVDFPTNPSKVEEISNAKVAHNADLEALTERIKAKGQYFGHNDF